MSTVGSAGIVGLGLIGGSLARDLRALGVCVHGLDADPVAVAGALDEGIIDAPLDPALDAAGDLDVIVLAVPVDAATAIMERSVRALRLAPLILDTCSTKRTVLASAARLGLARRFVGTHPLAGDHRSGWSASRAGLFRDAVAYICPHPDTAPAKVESARMLWERTGAIPELIAADAHDRLLAWTSHMPQVVSTAVARALAQEGLGPERLGPGGRDVTRLAASPADMWTAIALDNARYLDEAIGRMESGLSELRRALVKHDASGVHAFFSKLDVGSELRRPAEHSP